MGYRDNTTALQSQLEVLERDKRAQSKELEQLTTREAELRRTIKRKMLRIKLHRVGKWIVGHPKLVAVLLIITALVAYGLLQRYLKRRAYEQRVELLLQSCDSPTQLKLNASHRAGIYIGGLKVGRTPQDLAICPGNYRVQVVHRKTLPWQQVVQMEPGQPRRIKINLVPWRPTERPSDGLLIYSAPAGALLFIDGQEVGRTPAFIRRRPGQFSGERLTLALAMPGYRPRIWSVKQPRPGSPIWLHLSGQSPQRGRQR